MHQLHSSWLNKASPSLFDTAPQAGGRDCVEPSLLSIIRVVRDIRMLKKASLSLLLIGMTGCTMLPREIAEDDDKEAQIREYQDMAVQLRGLPLKHEVAIEKETKDELKKSMEKDLEKPDNKVALEESDRLLRQFRILDEEESLKEILLTFMQEEAAAYYDHEERRLVYLEEKETTNTLSRVGFQGMERFVYVHEFCHAIEDSHYNLTKRTKEVALDFDRSQALTSFIEGNAVLLGVDSFFDGIPFNTVTPLGAWGVQALMQEADMTESTETLRWCPPFITGALVRPYLDGASFCNRLRRDGGWQALNGLYEKRMPQTTAEILYPERRYLKGFVPATFAPEPSLLGETYEKVTTNSLGVMGIALLLGGETLAAAADFGFLEGWMGDQIYYTTDSHGKQKRLWLSYWERPGFASSFRWRMEDYLKEQFKDGSWSVQREGRLVAAVWSEDAKGQKTCESVATRALKTPVTVDRPSWLASWGNDLPWPVRFPTYEGHSVGMDLVGGWLMEADAGSSFYRFSLLRTWLLNVEENPDRHHLSTCFGLMRHVKDMRSDFTYWRIPVLASYLRCGQEKDERYEWSLLWGILADGTQERARVLFIPVWRSEK